jgi:hypothetical protein
MRQRPIEDPASLFVLADTQQCALSPVAVERGFSLEVSAVRSVPLSQGLINDDGMALDTVAARNETSRIVRS